MGLLILAIVGGIVVAAETDEPADLPPGVAYFKCDTGSEDDPAQLVRQAHAEMGAIDGLVATNEALAAQVARGNRHAARLSVDKIPAC